MGSLTKQCPCGKLMVFGPNVGWCDSCEMNTHPAYVRPIKALYADQKIRSAQHEPIEVY